MHKLIRIVFCLSVAVAAAVAAHADWPHLRGPNLDGRVSGAGVLDGDDLALTPGWQAPIGSAYSAITVSGRYVVTMSSDEKSNFVVALDAEKGNQIWRYDIDETYKGHDGSDDGPLSTPTIDDDLVYVLGPRGQLVALDLAEGKKKWQRDLEGDFKSKKPFYGFTTTPLVAGKVLVLQAGAAEGASIAGLDKKTGKTLWTAGDGDVEYQSPALLTLLGQQTVIATAGKKLTGFAPDTGKQLWEHELGEEESFSSVEAAPAGKDRFLVFISSEATVFEAAKTAGKVELSEVYRSKELGRNYSLPVLHDGYLYGFRNAFLTCVKAETGERVWKSRPPGGQGLILVDDNLVIFGSKGNVVVVKATPEGYQERARAQALEGSSLTSPAFSEGRVFVRNLDSIGSVVVTKAKPTAPVKEVSASAEAKHEFGRWVRSVEAAEGEQAKQAMIAEFLEGHTMPHIERNWVHFVYNGEAEDIAITGGMLDSDSADPMHRIVGTNFYHRSYQIEPDARWEYRYNINFDERVPDPLNPRQVPANWGEAGFSEVLMPGYAEPKHLAEAPEARRGTMETFQHESKIMGFGREVKVYLPAGYAKSKDRYPLLIVNNGPDWLEKGLLNQTLDNVSGIQSRPVVAAFITPHEQWWEEAGGAKTDDYLSMLATELIPHLEKKYRLESKPEARAMMGYEGFGTTAVYGALKHPGVFGNAAAQSIYTADSAGAKVIEMLSAGKPTGVKLYLDWNRYEDRSVDRGYDMREQSLEVAGILKEQGYAFAGGEALDGRGWGSWRARTDKILEAFFPAE